MLHVFVPKEIAEGESRLAATPETVKKYVRAGLKVTVQAGAGEAAGFLDDAFREAGAEIGEDAKALFADADVVLKLNPPQDRGDGTHEADLLKEGAFLVSFLYPALNPETVKKLAARKATGFAMDLVPRISRAQKMDALSSQSNVAGYKAVIIAADRLRKIFPLLMTAAGTLKPAKVVILGAGVAGLQAIATAKRLGAVVEVNDIRAAAKEQVESLGGRFIDMPVPEDAEDAGGYAKDLGEEFLKKQQEILAQHIADADAVITTALIPGKPAPRLVTEDVVKRMRPGSVIVDLAAVMGGNCEITEPGQTVVRHGVTIVGETNFPGLVPFHSSELYARNVEDVMKLVVKEAALAIDMEDEINAGSIATHEGRIRKGPDAVPEPEPVPEPVAEPEKPEAAPADAEATDKEGD